MSLGVAGAGLPKAEQMFIKWGLVPIVRILFTWRIALFMIQKEVRKIQKLVASVDENRLQQRVEIQRAFAIEDHSRDYSVNMTLEHLRITGSAIIKVIETLTQEKAFERPITIEAVKPKENGSDEHTKFFAFMNEYAQYIKQHPKNYSKMTKKHPWFVNFNNSDWACFMFMHTFIHRRQIEAIIKELKHDKL